MAALDPNQEPASGGLATGSATGVMFEGDWLGAGLAILDEAGGAVDLNEPLRNWLGLKNSQEIPGGDFWSLLWKLQPKWREPVHKFLQNSDPFGSFNLVAEGGALKQWFTLELARHRGGCFVRLSSMLPPLADLQEGTCDEHLQSESARRQLFVRVLRAEGQLNNLIRRWPGVIFSQRVDLSFQFVSPKIESLTGVPLAEWMRLPQRFWETVHEGDADELQQQFRRAARSPNGVTSTFRIRNLQTGRVAYVLEHREAVRTRQGLLLGYEGVWLDVTRQTIAEKRLSTAAWKETLALLTMGLAHDFSNIMSGIHALSEAFQAQLGSEHPFREGLALIQRNSRQASLLIHRILHLHHGKLGERSYLNLNELTGDVTELARKIAPRQIRIETALWKAPLPVYADTVDAMPQGGRLRFSTSRHESYPPLAHVQGPLPRLPGVCVAVEDEGCGIPEQRLADIFDPFYTTKAINKGSGLGLYNARLFTEKHHGAISVNSAEQQGTTFRIWLPEADFTEAERAAVQPRGQRDTVLLFGCPGGALDSTTQFLRENGFQVLAAGSFERALELLRDSDRPLSGAILLAAGSHACYNRLVSAVRRAAFSTKIIVQICGCNQDELDSQLLAGADLVLSPDVPRSELPARLNTLFQRER